MLHNIGDFLNAIDVRPEQLRVDAREAIVSAYEDLESAIEEIKVEDFPLGWQAAVCDRALAYTQNADFDEVALRLAFAEHWLATFRRTPGEKR